MTARICASMSTGHSSRRPLSQERSPCRPIPCRSGETLRPVLHRAHRRGADLRCGADGRRDQRGHGHLRRWDQRTYGADESHRDAGQCVGDRPQWSPSTANGHRQLPDRAVHGHELRRAQIATTMQSNDTGLSASASYTYRVRAADTVGTLGPYSNLSTAFTGIMLTPRQAALAQGRRSSTAPRSRAAERQASRGRSTGSPAARLPSGRSQPRVCTPLRLLQACTRSRRRHRIRPFRPRRPPTRPRTRAAVHLPRRQHAHR